MRISILKVVGLSQGGLDRVSAPRENVLFVCRMGLVRLSGCHPMRCWMSVRDVEEMMAARGVLVSYETVRLVWQVRQQYADGLRGGRARTGDRWRLDEVFLTINGVTHYL